MPPHGSAATQVGATKKVAPEKTPRWLTVERLCLEWCRERVTSPSAGFGPVTRSFGLTLRGSRPIRELVTPSYVSSPFQSLYRDIGMVMIGFRRIARFGKSEKGALDPQERNLSESEAPRYRGTQIRLLLTLIALFAQPARWFWCTRNLASSSIVATVTLFSLLCVDLLVPGWLRVSLRAEAARPRL
jgi:hypothetical protein